MAQHHRVAGLHAVLSYFTNDDDRTDHATQVFNPCGISKHGLRRQRRAIEQVEAIWAPIAEHDDWSYLHEKLAEIHAMSDAYHLREQAPGGILLSQPIR